ncbi:hypothetical protein F4677DRAFT_406683 [Hypoxylon crocopeplum]|nr:hypothetical protein F4677DRAFT_406683 [Hypoxylon crocopeplum]
MQFPSFLLLPATFAVLSGLASAFDTTPFIGPLDPWKVTRLQITAPATGPASVDLAVENPNTVSAGPAPHAAGGGYLPFSPSAANCTAVDADAALGDDACVETTEFSYGVWSVDATGPIDPQNLDLSFTLNYNVSRWGSVLVKVYEATAHFAVGLNLADGVCDNVSGTCEFGLLPGSTPVLIPPTMTQCQGTCSLP